MALKSAKLAHCAPRKIAEAVVAHMPEDPAIEKVEIAGPRFINFYLSVAVKNAIFGEAREKGMDFAKSNVGGGLKTRVEFVSANPVGPMHIGHGRWAALGDSLCRVMDHAGYDIQREFYINDHGSQMNTFGNSISTRYMQLADIIAKQGVDIDEAHKLLIADRDAFVADENDEHPETHPYQTTLPRLWARTPTAATTSSTRPPSSGAPTAISGSTPIRRSAWRASASAAM